MVSSNPLEDDPARDLRIQERAYHLWQADGEPHGSDVEYWERARELVALEESSGAGQIPVPSEAAQQSGAGQIVEEAFIQENLGEFPDRLADQGERQQTPSADLRRSGS